MNYREPHEHSREQQHLRKGIAWLVQGVDDHVQREIRQILRMLESGVKLSAQDVQTPNGKMMCALSLKTVTPEEIGPGQSAAIRQTLLELDAEVRQQLLRCLVCPLPPPNPQEDFRLLGQMFLSCADQCIAPGPVTGEEPQTLREITRVRMFRHFPAVAPSLSVLLEHCDVYPGKKSVTNVRLEPPNDYPAHDLREALSALQFRSAFIWLPKNTPPPNATGIWNRFRRWAVRAYETTLKAEMITQVGSMKHRVTGIENTLPLSKQLTVLASKNPRGLVREHKAVEAAFDKKGTFPRLPPKERQLARALLLEMILHGQDPRSNQRQSGATALEKFLSLPRGIGCGSWRVSPRILKRHHSFLSSQDC